MCTHHVYILQLQCYRIRMPECCRCRSYSNGLCVCMRIYMEKFTACAPQNWRKNEEWSEMLRINDFSHRFKAHKASDVVNSILCFSFFLLTHNKYTLSEWTISCLCVLKIHSLKIGRLFFYHLFNSNSSYFHPSENEFANTNTPLITNVAHTITSLNCTHFTESSVNKTIEGSSP